MARGQTRKGRSRTALMAAVSSSRPLLKAQDHGEPVSIHAQDVGASGDRWVEPFLAANMAGLRRLGLRHEIRVDPVLRVMLKPGPRIGAVPLLSPATRKVAAGLLIEPRFRDEALARIERLAPTAPEPSARLRGAAERRDSKR